MRMYENQQNDISLGEKGEIKFLEYFNDNYENKLVKKDFKFSVYDFDVYDEEDNLIGVFELKTRRIKSNSYDTIIFGKNKLKKFRKLTKEGLVCRVYFLFLDILDYFHWDSISHIHKNVVETSQKIMIK